MGSLELFYAFWYKLIWVAIFSKYATNEWQFFIECVTELSYV